MLLAGLAAVAVAACGSQAQGSALGPQARLAQAFGAGRTVTSGRLALTVVATPASGDPTSLTVSGPFAARGAGAVPAFDFAVALQAQGRTLQGGLLSTGTDAFITFGGRTYQVGPDLFAQFAAGYRGALPAGSKGRSGALAALGIDPRRWLTGARRAGTETVGGVPTDHLTADVRLSRLLTDLNGLAGRAGSSALGALAGQASGGSLTAAQLARVSRSVRGARVDVFIGRKDGTLRRLVVRLDVAGDAGRQVMGFSSGTVAIDLTLTAVNRPQTITAPAGAVPLSALQSLLQGMLARPGTAPPTAATKELRCLRAAGRDRAKARACIGTTG